MITKRDSCIHTEPAKWISDGVIAFSTASIRVNDTVPSSFVRQLKKYFDDGSVTLHTSSVVPPKPQT